jgi:L-ascorbate metabolism protein UlaG (beta-lactamase superfamily)
MRWHKTILFFILLIFSSTFCFAVKIQWLGQGAFCITAQDGTKIITDPYTPGTFMGKQINYGPITTKADFVTVSHDHPDPNYMKSFAGTPQIFETLGSFTAKNITIHGVPSYRDKEQGANRGTNIIYTFAVDGLNICHLGELGHILTPTMVKQIQQMGPVDVLLIPVGGVTMIDAMDATKITDQLKPKIVIPMHYKTDKITFPLKAVEQFTQDKKDVIVRGTSTIEITTKSLPLQRVIDVLQPAM